MKTICSGYRDKQNNIIPCGVLLKDHDKDTKALLEACKEARAVIEEGSPYDKRQAFLQLEKAITLAEEESSGTCESCFEKFKELL